MRAVLRERRPSPQNGETRFGSGRRVVPARPETSQPPRGEKAIDTTLYPVVGACVPVSRRQLSTPELPEDAEGSEPHESVQTENERGLSHLQAARCAVLLPREALPRGQVSGAVLFEYQVQDEAATAPAEVATGAAFTQTYGGDEHKNCRTYAFYRWKRRFADVFRTAFGWCGSC